jgi:predicted ArsR family transcriptional regulator
MPQQPDLASLSSLDDPVRQRLYAVVSGRAEPVSRDDAAEAAGISRALAAYHLDKLVGAGLLTATYERPEGRTGPGAGRPAKLYSRSDREFVVSVPPREYELAARLLVRAVESDSSGRSRTALNAAAYQLGQELGSQVVSGRSSSSDATNDSPARRDLETVLARHGYEPERCSHGVTRLRNCPFHQLAQQHKDTVCAMNLALIDGVTASLQASTLRLALDPQPGYCCVAISADRPSPIYARKPRRTDPL